MITIKGDLITYAQLGTFDVIVHGCNCFNTMGAGIAKQIKDYFPSAFIADCASTYGSKLKLGSYTKSYIELDDCIKSDIRKGFYVINAYTQYNTHRKDGKPPVNYNAIRNVFKQINKDFKGKIVAYPAIGAGLAGGDWSIIAKIIEEELTDVQHYFVEFYTP